MKNILLVCFINTFSINAFCQNRNSTPLEVKCFSISKAKKESKEGYFAMVSVKNIGDTNCTFVIMNCSWPRHNFLLSNRSFSIPFGGCDANTQEIITLLPNKSIYFNIFISRNSNPESNYKTQIGFIYFRSPWKILDYVSGVLKETPNIIWSNEITLQNNVYKYTLE